jgi:hypothetical protein
MRIETMKVYLLFDTDDTEIGLIPDLVAIYATPELANAGMEKLKETRIKYYENTLKTNPATLTADMAKRQIERYKNGKRTKVSEMEVISCEPS